MPGPFEDRTVAITGAASGIGRATAFLLAYAGANTILLDRDTDALHALTVAVGAAVGTSKMVQGVVCDVSDAASVAHAFESIEARWVSLDGLVNNAGVHELTPLEEITQTQVDHMMHINLGGVINCTQAALPLLFRGNGSAIVSVASLSGVRGHPVDSEGRSGSAHYAASKGAVIAFTRSVALELAKRGVRANCIAPGMIATPLNAHSYTSEQTARYADNVPLGRAGQPQDVAEAIGFLVGPRSAYITGQVLNVCGGVLTA